MDAREFAFGGSRPVVERKLARPLLNLLAEAMERITELETIYLESETQLGADACDSGDSSESALRNSEAASCRQISDMCFAARFEMSRVQRSMESSMVDLNRDLVIECESAGRKVRRALAHLEVALRRAEGRSIMSVSTAEAETEAAIAVRRLYRRFRKRLVFLEGASDLHVRKSLSIALGSLTNMMRDPDYGEVRIHDRRLLDGLEDRILNWAQLGQSAYEGEHLCQDIAAAAELLAGINQRQELQLHDTKKVVALLARTKRTRRPDVDEAQAVMRELGCLEGLSSHVDAILDQLNAGQPAPSLWSALCKVLEELAEQRAQSASHEPRGEEAAPW